MGEDEPVIDRRPDDGPSIEELPPRESVRVAPGPVVPPSGRGGARWVAALLVVALVVAVSAAGTWFLAGQAATSTLAGWVPSDSVAYAEARLDLPGDQRQQLGNVLAHLPGFRDQSTLDDKIAETFDRAVRSATDGTHDYSSEIRPWFGGEVAVAVGPLPTIDENDSAGRPDVRFVLLASVTNRAAADAWVARIASEAHTAVGTETYGGVSLRTTTANGHSHAVAVLDRALLAGDSATVHAAIDTGGTRGLAANSEFARATAALTGDHLGGGWVNLRAYVDWATELSRRYGAPAASRDPKLLGLVPAWVASDVRATDGDALTLRSVLPHTAAVPVVARGPSTLTAHLPASTIAVVDGHEYGSVVEAVLATWRTIPSMASTMAAVDRGLQAVGGEDAALGWIGETALVAARDGGGITGGLVVAPKDAARAEAFARQIRNLLVLAGSTTGVTTRDEDDGGTAVTIVTAEDPGRLFGAARPGSPTAGERVELAFAVRDDLVVVGPPAFVRLTLDTTQRSSLASNARFSTAAARIGSDSPGFGWVDVTAVRDLLEANAPAGADRDRYEREVRPYLAPFDMLALGVSTSNDLDESTVTLITK